jgi:hypothetical protein
LELVVAFIVTFAASDSADTTEANVAVARNLTVAAE